MKIRWFNWDWLPRGKGRPTTKDQLRDVELLLAVEDVRAENGIKSDAEALRYLARAKSLDSFIKPRRGQSRQSQISTLVTRLSRLRTTGLSEIQLFIARTIISDRSTLTPGKILLRRMIRESIQILKKAPRNYRFTQRFLAQMDLRKMFPEVSPILSQSDGYHPSSTIDREYIGGRCTSITVIAWPTA
jgi:hypothetical protein